MQGAELANKNIEERKEWFNRVHTLICDMEQSFGGRPSEVSLTASYFALQEAASLMLLEYGDQVTAKDFIAAGNYPG